MRAWGLLLGCSLAACLPETTRPEPGIVEVYASGAAELSSAITTADGWSIRFERALVSTTVESNSYFEATDCDVYSQSRSTHVLTLLGGGSQKIGRLAALGTCDLGVSLSPP